MQLKRQPSPDSRLPSSRKPSSRNEAVATPSQAPPPCGQLKPASYDAIFAAAIAALVSAVVTLLEAFDQAFDLTVAAVVTRQAGPYVAGEAHFYFAGARATIVVIIVAVVAFLGALLDAVAAFLTRGTRDWACKPWLDVAAARAAVTIVVVAVVAFLAIVEHAIAASCSDVAAARASATGGLAFAA